jgi:Cu+-exporting ATPase
MLSARDSRAVERNSTHPIAKAICDYAVNLDIDAAEIAEVNTIRGRGISATHGQQSVQVGSIQYLTSLNIDISHASQQLNVIEQNAWTPVAIAIDGQLKGVLGISDTIKQDAAQTVERLRSLGIDTIMLTGDDHTAAKNIALQLGIDNVIAEVLPDQKSKKIRELQQQGKVVAMVGDGINDAAALSQADLSFAMGSGSDIAIESAQITLLNSSPLTVVNAIELSKATVKNIQQNLIGAFIYNVIGIPVAAGVLFPWFGFLLNPMVAGAAMALSSITVVSNANRLRRFKPSIK